MTHFGDKVSFFANKPTAQAHAARAPNGIKLSVFVILNNVKDL